MIIACNSPPIEILNMNFSKLGKLSSTLHSLDLSWNMMSRCRLHTYDQVEGHHVTEPLR